MSSLGFSSKLLIAALVVATTGCGGVTAFQGKEAFAIAATPPPPPPPPPPLPPPPPPPPKVEIHKAELKGDRIDISEKVQFEVNKATIKPESFKLLDEVADIIKKNPQFKKISIDGHASAEGDAKANEKLSDERAKSVRQYLIDKGGVKAELLVAKGYGAAKPIGDNKTEDGREKNRRVEFLVSTEAAAPVPAHKPPPGVAAPKKPLKAGKK